jgi:hypothetical protein
MKKRIWFIGSAICIFLLLCIDGYETPFFIGAKFGLLISSLIMQVVFMIESFKGVKL